MLNFALSQVQPPRQFNSQADRLLIETLYENLHELNPDQLVAVYLRFWQQMTIQQVARFLNRSWSSTDELLESAISELRSRMVKKIKSGSAA